MPEVRIEMRGFRTKGTRRTEDDLLGMPSAGHRPPSPARQRDRERERETRAQLSTPAGGLSAYAAGRGGTDAHENLKSLDG